MAKFDIVPQDKETKPLALNVPSVLHTKLEKYAAIKKSDVDYVALKLLEIAVDQVLAEPATVRRGRPIGAQKPSESAQISSVRRHGQVGVAS